MHLRSEGFWPRVAAVMLLCALGNEQCAGATACFCSAIDDRSRSGWLTGCRGSACACDGAAAGHRGVGKIERENGKYTLRQQAYEVRLNATVLDGNGDSILDLKQDAFHVYEDGVPQTIVSFRHEDLPISLGILIDSSGSMYDKRTAVDQASLDLVKLSNPEDEAFLVDFSWEPFIDQDFTSDINKLKDGLGYIKSSGGTALYDTLIASADYLTKNAKRRSRCCWW